MKNKNSNLAIIAAILFEIILISGIIFNIVMKEWKDLYLYFMTVICIILPFIIVKLANIKKIVLPASFKLISVIFIFLAQYFGEIMQFYSKLWWWDLLLHGAFGCYAVIVGFNLTEETIIKTKEVTQTRFIIFVLIFSFSFSITLGAIWEIVEFLGDYFFKTDMVNGGLEDTTTDLLINMLGAFIVCLIYYRRRLKA